MTDTGDTADRVERSVVLEAAPDEVWPFLTEAGLLATWLGGDVEIDPRPRGVVALVDAGGARRGTIETFDPPRRMVLRVWSPPVAGDASLSGSRIAFELDDLGAATRLTVVESRLGAEAGAAVGFRLPGLQLSGARRG